MKTHLKGAHALLLFSTVWVCDVSVNVHAQSRSVSDEYVYRISAGCGTNITTGTAFLSAEREALVTALHVVDGACTITASSATDDLVFDNLRITHTGITNDIAVLSSTELEEYLDKTDQRGYQTHPGPGEELTGPGISFGFARNTPTLLTRPGLSIQSRGILSELVFPEDLIKWKNCASPDPSTRVYRVVGIASPGDSGGPLFLKNDPRVIGMISGGRAYDDVIWATDLALALAEENLTDHASGANERIALRNAQCRDLRYFYDEEEEERLRILFGLPLKDDSEPVPDRPRPWYRQGWLKVVGAAVTGVVIFSLLSDNDNDNDNDEPTRSLTLDFPLP